MVGRTACNPASRASYASHEHSLPSGTPKVQHVQNEAFIGKHRCLTEMWERQCHKHLSTFINIYKHLSTSTNIYKHLSTSINIYQHLSTPINIYKHLSTSINIHQHLSTSKAKTNIYQDLVTSTHPVLIYIYIYVLQKNNGNISKQ